MENLGERILEYRRAAKLTQKELGDMLNVSAQAVSKWENGQAEPDMSTAIKMCEIFKISTNELLGVEPPAQETAATAAVNAVPPPAPVTVEQKLIYGNCATCKKPLGVDEAIIIKDYGGGQKLYCKECNKKRVADEARAHDLYEYSEHKRATVKSFIWGPVAGVIALAILLAVTLTDAELKADGGIVIAVVLGVGFFTFVTQMFWGGLINDMFFFFLKSFKMPGVIFTLDLDGLLFLIFVKIFGAILGVLLSVIFFLIGLIITPLVSIPVFPFALIKRIFEGKTLKTTAEKNYKVN